MKRFLLLLLIIALCFGIVVRAEATLYDFNSIPVGTYDETAFNALFTGVVFDDPYSTLGWEVLDHGSLQPDFSGNVVLPRNTGSYTQATFDTATDYASVTMGGATGNLSSLALYAYDSSDNQVDNELYANPAGSLAGVTLSVSSASANIKYILFYGLGDYSVDGAYFDNVSTSAPVPEPATVLLIGTGLVGLAGFRKKFRK